MNEVELKATLTDILASEALFKETDWAEISKHMLAHIGAIDPVLRDELICSTFYNIISNDLLPFTQLADFAQILISENYLFKGIGLKEDDSVFTRTFSSLIISRIVWSDQRHRFLQVQDMKLIQSKLLTYFVEEQDVRGYVAEKGWAHSVAHAADAINEVVLHPLTSKQDLPLILATLMKRVWYGDTTFYAKEDRRIVTPVLALLKQGFSEEDLCNFLEKETKRMIEELPKVLCAEWITPATHRQCANVTNFLRSLYFATKNQDTYQVTHQKVTELLTLL